MSEPRPHVTDGSPCWCKPKRVSYKKKRKDK